MQPTAEFFLALRYLRPKRTFISVITLLSILGPVLGVALLVIVTAVMSGFDRDIRERILDLQAHVQILPRYSSGSFNDGIQGLPDTDGVLTALNDIGIEAAPIIEGPVLIQVRKAVSTKYVRGIVPELEQRVTSIRETVQGRFDITEGQAVIGQGMAAELGLGIGDRFLIHSPHRLAANVDWDEQGRIMASEIDEMYVPEEVEIAGIFSLGMHEYDASILFLHMDQAADLFGLDWGTATSVHASVPDPFDMDALIAEMRRKLPDCRVLSWQEANSRLFGALRVEKNLMFFLLTFIVIVASFGIATTLITVVVQKTREIGIMKAVGMTSGMVARIFLLQGAIIGVIGVTLGTLLGWLVIRFRDQIALVLEKLMNVEVFPQELYHLYRIPALMTFEDVALIVVVALLICIGAALIPALYASWMSPAAALQEEG